MKVWQIVLFGTMLVVLAGCKTLGLSGKRVDYGAGAAQAPALEVPPDLTSPVSDERYRVPQGGDESVATFSDYRKTGSGQDGEGIAAVLPEVKGVRLERSGTQRWLVVNDTPRNVWSVVKAFWQESGLTIKSEDHAAGVMETEWMEGRISIPADGKASGKSYSPGVRDQYRMRLERGKDGAGTEVYITHRGMEEVFVGDKNTSKWQARPDDPEMEAIMLQRLMARFDGSEARAAGGRSATGAPGTTGGVALRESSDGRRVIVVNDAFDRSWRRVGLAIERAGFVVEDKDRAKGVYFLRPPKAENGWLDKLQFWKDNEGANMRYRVDVRDGGVACEVTVTNQNGVSDNTSKLMIEAIYRNVNDGGSATAPAASSAIETTGPTGTATLQEIFDDSRIIVMNESFDRSWNRLGTAIERAGLAVENSDRDKGVYFLRPAEAESSLLDKLEFWRDNKTPVPRYRVNLRDGGRACEVSVTDQYGAKDDATRQMIEAIYKNIDQ